MLFKYFSPVQLYEYVSRALNSDSQLTKNEYEILAALTFLIAYKGEYKPASYYLGFPIRKNLSEKEVKEIPNDIDSTLKMIEDDSLEDIRIGIKENQGEKYILPLQIKRVDLKIVDDTSKMIGFLKKTKKKYSKSKTRLIIVYEDIVTPLPRKEGKSRMSLLELEKWFSENDFPFQEIILLHFKNYTTREIVFFQFWPKMDTLCREKKFNMKDVMNFIKTSK